eukprot:5627787-Pyramimonas_sp.AAC.1
MAKCDRRVIRVLTIPLKEKIVLLLANTAKYANSAHYCSPSRGSLAQPLTGTTESASARMLSHAPPALITLVLVYSHDGPIGRRKFRYILPTDQSDAGIPCMRLLGGLWVP